MLNKLDKMAELCEIRTCRRKYLLNYFGEAFPNHCGSCDICLSKYEKEDRTIVAEKALSAVARLNERYGISFLVDFLRGSKSEKIKPEHTQLKTYGVGSDLSKEQWIRYVKDLLYMGYLKQEGDIYPILKLTEKGKNVLRGEEKVFLVKAITRFEAEENISVYEKDLLTKLKYLRTQLAEKENVPAYIIFSDATLTELATYLPQDIFEVKQISGFGEIKTEKYGTVFLNAIKAYCKEHNLNSRISNKNPRRIRKSASSFNNKPDIKQESLDLYRSGKSIDQIAGLRNLNRATIEGHLAHFILEGEIEVTELVNAKKIPAIESAIKLHGQHLLKTLKDELGEEYSYVEIKAVVNYLNRKN